MERIARAAKLKKWDEALRLVDTALAENPNDDVLTQRRFMILAVGREDREAALACAQSILERSSDANFLNSFAWVLLTKEHYQNAYDELALRLSQRCNELSRFRNWAHVDTLALATFRAGDARAAIELQ